MFMENEALTDQVIQQTGGSIVRKVFSVLGVMVAAGAIAAAIAGAAYVGLCAYAANGKTIWPGITVLGQELGGLTVEEATTKLNSFINNATVELYLYDQAAAPESHDRTADYTYTLEDLGFHPDTRKIAQEDVVDGAAQGDEQCECPKVERNAFVAAEPVIGLGRPCLQRQHREKRQRQRGSDAPQNHQERVPESELRMHADDGEAKRCCHRHH